MAQCSIDGNLLWRSTPLKREWEGIYCNLENPTKECCWAELNGECHQAYCPFQTTVKSDNNQKGEA